MQPQRSSISTFAVLIGVKGRILANRVRQTAARSPLKIALTIVFVGVIWLGLYSLFIEVFYYFQQSRVQSVIAIPLVFNVFFVALMILLGFSNAVLMYGALFGPGESGFLLASPIPPRHLVALKYLESLVLSSWSLLLLGLPLMMAIARASNEPWYFCPLFLAFFVFFVPIPGAIGLAAAWVAVRWLPANPRRLMTWTATGAILIAALWFGGLWGRAELDPDAWLSRFFLRINLIQGVYLPSTWISEGIDQALHARWGTSAGYLAVTASNALLLSWAAIHVVSRRFAVTFDRAQSHTSRLVGRTGSLATGFAGALFWYLPPAQRLMAAKDLRTFLRDPLQWSQLVILFGLMALYLLNMPRIHPQLPSLDWKLMVNFLNIAAVSFILATFTTRFVFPLISLEGPQLWLIGLLPLPRGGILRAKFAFALTITLITATAVMLLASRMLQMDWSWIILYLTATWSVCAGLCGIAVGLGARMPMFGERNATRIASGAGGTISLIVSVGIIVVMLTGIAGISLYVRGAELESPFSPVTLGILALIVAIGVGMSALCMGIGRRHFNRVQV